MKPQAFAAVMATGIVSIAASDHGIAVVSLPLAALAVIALPVLMYLTASRWRTFDLSDVDTVCALYTYVAAAAVLATRFAGYRVAVWIFGALALQGWLSVGPMLLKRLRALGPAGARARARGLWELTSVATSGLAIVFSTIGIVFWALTFWVLALCLYAVVTALVAARAVRDPAVRRDVPADHWILMGGLAIATVAGVHIHAALPAGPLAGAVCGVTIATLAVATVQIPPLLMTGWRRMLDWPAVFPLGMYSAATHAVADETGRHVLSVVSLVFFWIALAAWLLVVTLTVRGRIGSRRSPAAGTP